MMPDEVLVLGLALDHKMNSLQFLIANDPEEKGT
jgi:hypothetical protein